MTDDIIFNCSFYILLQQNKKIDLNASSVLFIVFMGVGILFIFCFYGKIATESFEDMAVCLFEANWQTLPIELQKYFILMIGNAQQPLYYHGSGMIVLDLQIFTKVSSLRIL